MKTISKFFFFFAVISFFFSCTPEELAPVVTTADITDITDSSAVSGGAVTSDGNSPVTARGICWNTTGNPTIADNKTTDGEGTGSFVSEMKDLKANTTYYVRAYAANAVGTSYGNEVSFKTEIQVVEFNNVKIERDFETSISFMLDFYSENFQTAYPESQMFSLSNELKTNEIEEIKLYIDSLKNIEIDSMSCSIYKSDYGMTDVKIENLSMNVNSLISKSLENFKYISEVYPYIEKYSYIFTGEELNQLENVFLDTKNLSFVFNGSATNYSPAMVFGQIKCKIIIFANFKATVKSD